MIGAVQYLSNVHLEVSEKISPVAITIAYSGPKQNGRFSDGIYQMVNEITSCFDAWTETILGNSKKSVGAVGKQFGLSVLIQL